MIEGHGEAKAYLDGQVIFHEGDSGDELYVIKLGQVKITRDIEDLEITLAVLQEGDFFAEMSLLDGGQRSATATAVGDVMLMAYDSRLVMDAIQTNPMFGLGLLRTMSLRLRRIDDEIVRMVSRGILPMDEIMEIGRGIYGGPMRMN